jgi:hypothetical protein
MADILEDCAVDPLHQPAIYAAFIREIVRKTKESRTLPSRVASPVQPGANATATTLTNGTLSADTVYDPQLLNETANWQPGDMLNNESAQFTFIPQGGDMM